VLDVSLLQSLRPWGWRVSRSTLRVLLCAVAVVVLTTAEVTCLNLVAIDRVRPDLVLVVLVCLATERATAGTFCWAAAGGLLQDTLGTGILGINVFSKTIVCIAMSYVGTRMVIRRPALMVTLVFAATLLDTTVQYPLLAEAGLLYPAPHYIFQVMLPCAFYNSLITPLVSFGTERYTKRLDLWTRAPDV